VVFEMEGLPKLVHGQVYNSWRVEVHSWTFTGRPVNKKWC